MEQQNKRLRELKGSDYQIVDEQPNINGWPLYTSDHQKIGKVEDLLFDPEQKKVRYIIADLDGNDLDIDDKEILIPIGIAQLDEDDDEVIVPGITVDHLRMLPAYNDDRGLSDADEQAIFSVISGPASVGEWTGATDNRYNHAHFDDQYFYRQRNTSMPTDNSRARNLDSTDFRDERIDSRSIRLRSRIDDDRDRLNRDTDDFNRDDNDRNRI